MKFALYSPCFGAFADPRLLAGLAHDAEEAGWDGYFLWDHVLFGYPQGAPMGDPWVTLAAMAMTTSWIRLGTAVTPLPRRRPSKLAREVATLDHLSGGRIVLGVGIGSDVWGHEYSAFGEAVDDSLHGEMLDEGLEVLAGLWSGARFSYEGKHYTVNDVLFLPTPVQQPRVPVWVAGTWPKKKPFRRAARWDGVMPQAVDRALTPDDYREIVAFVKELRGSDAPFEVTRQAFIPRGEPGEVAGVVREFERAGVTWWLHPLEDDMGTLQELRARVLEGPPKL